jgi:hypothetical protein
MCEDRSFGSGWPVPQVIDPLEEDGYTPLTPKEVAGLVSPPDVVYIPVEDSHQGVISPERTMEDRLTEVGKLCDEKQKEYGDAVSRAKEIMKIFYPDGVSVDQYGDVLLMVRVIDKLSRIATNAQAFGESPSRDIAGYAALWMREHGE